MKIEKQEEEILSQKMHNSRDDSAPFQEANRKMRSSNANAIRQDRHDYYTKPHVTLIGTSNIKGINPDKLSSRYSVDKITAFTLCETQSSVRNITQNPTALVLHSLSNDLKNYTPQQCVDHMKDIVISVHEEYPETKIVISLPTPRSDSSALNTKAQLVSVMIKECFIDDKFVMWCDNSNMSYKGEALPQFIDRKDGVHLTPNGTAVLAANIRDTVDRILDLPERLVYKQSN